VYLKFPRPVRLSCFLVHNSSGETDAECSDCFELGLGKCAIWRPSYLNIDLVNLFGRLGPEPTHVMLRRCAELQGAYRSGALRNGQGDPCRLRCRGRPVHEDRRFCGSRFGYSLASGQKVEDGGEAPAHLRLYCGRPPQLAASFISNVLALCGPYASSPLSDGRCKADPSRHALSICCQGYYAVGIATVT
jgi:hypothetical protein